MFLTAYECMYACLSALLQSLKYRTDIRLGGARDLICFYEKRIVASVERCKQIKKKLNSRGKIIEHYFFKTQIIILLRPLQK